MTLKMSSTKYRPFSSGLNVLRVRAAMSSIGSRSICYVNNVVVVLDKACVALNSLLTLICWFEFYLGARSVQTTMSLTWRCIYVVKMPRFGFIAPSRTQNQIHTTVMTYWSHANTKGCQGNKCHVMSCDVVWHAMWCGVKWCDVWYGMWCDMWFDVMLCDMMWNAICCDTERVGCGRSCHVMRLCFTAPTHAFTLGTVL